MKERKIHIEKKWVRWWKEKLQMKLMKCFAMKLVYWPYHNKFLALYLKQCDLGYFSSFISIKEITQHFPFTRGETERTWKRHNCKINNLEFIFNTFSFSFTKARQDNSSNEITSHSLKLLLWFLISISRTEKEDERKRSKQTVWLISNKNYFYFYFYLFCSSKCSRNVFFF